MFKLLLNGFKLILSKDVQVPDKFNLCSWNDKREESIVWNALDALK